MSTLFSPFGLRPAFNPSGIIRQMQASVESGFASNIYQNAPVGFDANGFLVPVAPGGRIVGVFAGVEFTQLDGRRAVAPFWTANTVGSEIVAYYSALDPYGIFEIQANASIGRDQIGQQFDWTAQSGNPVPGTSTVALDVASAAANAGLRVVGLNPAADNIFDDPFPVVQVQISEHQFVADQASI